MITVEIEPNLPINAENIPYSIIRNKNITLIQDNEKVIIPYNENYYKVCLELLSFIRMNMIKQSIPFVIL